MMMNTEMSAGAGMLSRELSPVLELDDADGAGEAPKMHDERLALVRIEHFCPARFVEHAWASTGP
jgi:hypothetical protein